MIKKHRCCECENEAKYRLGIIDKINPIFYCENCVREKNKYIYSANGFQIKDDELKSYVSFEDIIKAKNKASLRLTDNEYDNVSYIILFILKYGNCSVKKNVIDYNKFMCKLNMHIKSNNKKSYDRFFSYLKILLKDKKISV